MNDDELMWNGWILNPDGSLHGVQVIDQAILPDYGGALVQLSYAFTVSDQAAGRVRMIQLRLTSDQAETLAAGLFAAAGQDQRAAAC